MSIVHRNRARAADPTVNHQDLPRPQATPPPAGPAPRTATGTTWLAVCTAAAASVVLIVFMLQSTRDVEVTFLWLHGNVPLALALLVAGVGAAFLGMALGAARIARLHRLAGRSR